MKGTPVAIEITSSGALIYLPATRERAVVPVAIGKALEYILQELVSLRNMAHVHHKLEIVPELLVHDPEKVKKIRIPKAKAKPKAKRGKKK